MPERCLRSADPGPVQSPIGVAPVALPILAAALDSDQATLLNALRDELPIALSRGRVADWARAGHSIVDLLAGTIEHRLGNPERPHG